MSWQAPTLSSVVLTIDYAVPGLLTGLHDVPCEALDPIAKQPIDICSHVHGLVVEPTDVGGLGLSQERFAENQIRPAGALVNRLLALDPAPLSLARDPARRVVGTCRHFAVLCCALLRYRGIAARVRCGFATYFQPGRGVDHWLTEYRDDAGRWVRVDPEILDQAVVDSPQDLQPGQFLTGGEAWLAFRRGEIDASCFGVYGTDNWGTSEIRGNAVRDLAALNKFEMLPWDEWGRMTDAYDGKTGADYDDLLDTLAATCAVDDPATVIGLYRNEDLVVPPRLIQ